MKLNKRKSVRAIQQIILAAAATTFTVGALAALGQQNPPPGPGQVPDYFGVVPNFATSPQPVLAKVTITDAGGGTGAIAAATTYDYNFNLMTDTIMDVQVLNGGSNYSPATTVTIEGGPGVTTPAQVTPIITAGVITGFTINNAGAGYKKPIAGSGIRKFVDSLPGVNSPNNLGQNMPLAVADTTTFPGADYYEIAEVEYKQQLHSDLPPTFLRGYVQIKPDGFTLAGYNTAADKLAYASQYAGYLGPVIIAQRDRPVRIKLVNLISKSGDGSLMEGRLPVPVDTTYMGTDGPGDTDNRTSMHLHGGNTPWISDGTPRQWVKPAGEIGDARGESARNVPDMWYFADGSLVPNSPTCTQGSTTCTTPGANNDPGLNALTFFYTNEQSARLMFYHDHAEGITRLNVYMGMAAGYVIQDATEQAMINGGTVDGVTYAAGTLPPASDTLYLVVQEKTFMPDDKEPILNFYGPFKSALNSQDPTWRWGTGAAAPSLNGNGDLWVPHVFMPNQNPGDVTGANAMGRWDYGPWFWPPFAAIHNGQVANPYYDPNCNTTTQYCEGQFMPGTPNGATILDPAQAAAGQPSPGVWDATRGQWTSSPSSTPEAFNDTPLVNGTAYPYVNVDPKKYRMRFLSVGNDRMLNMSLVVAASNKTDTTALANFGTTGNQAEVCNGTNPNITSYDECTEVKMVPFDTYQNKAKPFPPHWYTIQKAGVTFDGRPSGVFDPDTRGPAMVQIGTEGGFLTSPVVIQNQPVNYVYNPKNILIGNINEHALLLGPAERADVLVDFSNFAGSTLILYNDAPAPVPAWDLRVDYYTGGFDNTDTGGSFSVIPGYGPNSRTLMQFRVSTNGGTSNPIPDDTGSIDIASLTTVLQTAFKNSQEPIIVPQSAHNGVYGINAIDKLGTNISRISDNWLTFQPLKLDTRDALEPATVQLELEPKTIIEDWTMNWGRMNALLGTEVPRTTAINQTSIPQAYIDPPTDLVKITPNDNIVPISGTLPDGTQLWKVTHNGVDSHSIHFHLFHVQIVNRVGWDGAVYAPAPNELGWKDSVLMHPLSDIIVALRPMVMSALPFKVPNSHRKLDPARPLSAPPMVIGSTPGTASEFFNFNPLNGNPTNVTNEVANFGWEYVWHCHILGHEENDMMRPIAVAQPPEAPTLISAAGGGTSVDVTWTDNSVISNWVTIQRSTDPNFATIDTVFNVVEPECADQAGCARSYTDTTVPANTSVYYRIMANNTVGAGDGKLDAPRNPDGTYGDTLLPELSSLTPGFLGYANVTANSNWSNTTARIYAPLANVTPASLAFPVTAVGATSATQAVTVTNNGYLPLDISNITASGPFAVAGGSCAVGTPVAVGANCTINVAFAPTVMGPATGNLVITDNSGGVVGATQNVTLSGTTPIPVANVSVTSLDFGSVAVGSVSAVQRVTLSNQGTATLTINSIAITGASEFKIRTDGCGFGPALPAGASCIIDLTFNPTTANTFSGNLEFSDNSNAVQSTQVVALQGIGAAPAPFTTLSTNILDFGKVLVGQFATKAIVVTNTGYAPLAISNVVINDANYSSVFNNCTGATLAVNRSCSIAVRFRPQVPGAITGSLVITDNSGGVTTDHSVTLSGIGGVLANADSYSLAAPTNPTWSIPLNVRANDMPSTLPISIVNGTTVVSNGGATATATVVNNRVVWTITGSQAAQKGTYKVNYLLDGGTETSTATATLTLN